MSVKDISWRKGELEINTSPDANGNPHVTLLKHYLTPEGRDYVCTLAYFHKDRDGYVSLIFVNDRPFTEISDININDVWKELFLTQMMLEGKED